MSHFGTGIKNRCSGNLQRQSNKLMCYKTYWEELRFLPLQSHFWVFLLAEARAWRQLYRACGVNTWCDPGSIWTRCLFRLNSSSPFTEEYSWLALTKDCCKLTVDWDVGVKEDILKIFYKELKKCAAESWCDMSGSIQRLNILFLQSLILGATRGGKQVANTTLKSAYKLI